MKNSENFVCRICGYEDSEPFWLQSGGSNFQICSCCWAESWYQDIQKSSVKNYRKKWLNNQIKWFDETKRPKDWDLIKQIKNIPDKYI